MRSADKKNVMAVEDSAIHEIVELSGLYDCYGGLLNEHKKQIFEDYVLNNYSLSEIAENIGISRQGVRDIIVRCSKQLRDYEDKLHIMKKSVDIISILDVMKKNIKDCNDIIRIEKSIQDIYDILM